MPSPTSGEMGQEGYDGGLEFGDGLDDVDEDDHPQKAQLKAEVTVNPLTR